MTPESTRSLARPVKFCSAGYSAMPKSKPPMPPLFRPRRPYARAKATAFREATNYRDAYNPFACTGIFFNHEFPLRPERFAIQKIISVGTAHYPQAKRYPATVRNHDQTWQPRYIMFGITIATKKPVTHFVSYQLRPVLGFNVHPPNSTVGLPVQSRKSEEIPSNSG